MTLEVYTDSFIDAEQGAELWAKQYHGFDGLLTIYGAGCGRQATAVLAGNDKCKVIVYDEDPHAVRRIGKHNRHLLLESRFALAQSKQQFQARFSTMIDRWKGLRVCTAPGYGFAQQKGYFDFMRWYAREVQTVMSDICTALRFSRDWTRNYIANIPQSWKAGPIIQMFNAWPMPVAIIASGPSLDGMLELVRELDRRALTIAAGSSFRKLQREGIEPDLVVSFDGGVVNFTSHFEDMQPTKTALVYDPIVNHMVVKYYKGPRLVMNVWPGDMLSRVLGGPVGDVRIGPSVANTAFDLACRFGTQQIVFVAQDLSFPDGKTHAKETHAPWTWFDKGDYALRAECEAVPYDDSSGRTITTSHSFVTFCHWFEGAIEQLQRPIEILNCSHPEGMTITGTTHATPEEVLRRLPDQDVREAKAMMLTEITKPPAWDLESARRDLDTYYDHGSFIVHRLRCGGTLESLIRDERMALYFFALQIAWDSFKSGAGESVSVRQAIQAIEWTQTMIREVLKEAT